MSDTLAATSGNGAAAPLAEAEPRTPVGTDFKAVAIGAGANLEGLPAYFTDPLLGTGNMPGIAISAFNNRALRQGTFVASSLCLWISDQIQQYVPDDGDQIHWISEWQNALADFVLALIPPGPNLGAYLPLAGGTMVGNINFQTGISTILSNNTWYFAQDSGGQARGLIIKNSNNDMTINDGSSAHVVIAGQPSTNNNFAWSGRDTTGTYRALIGLLSDNAIHIGSSATGELYFDITGSVHHSGNVILNNNHYLYGNDTGGAPRTMLGIATNNSLAIGSGVTSSTDIYSGGGQPIYLHSNANALGQIIVNGYTYANGGLRAYIPGGNDPFQIYADHGFYARLHFYAAGTRDWTCGALNSGPFAIADESAGAIRFQIDLSGNVTVYNSQVINNYLTIYGGMNVAGGNFNCGPAYIANAYVSNQVNCWDMHAGGSIFVGGLQVYNNGGWFYVVNGVHADSIYSRNTVGAAGQVYGSWIHSTGSAQVDASLTVIGCAYINGFQLCNSEGMFHVTNGGLACNGNTYFGGSSSYFAGDITTATVVIPLYNGGGYVGVNGIAWAAMTSYNYLNASDQRDKTDISPVPAGCLDLVRKIVPQSYKLALREPKYDRANPELFPTKAEGEGDMARRFWGFLAQDVGRVMDEAGHDFGGHVVSDDGDNEALAVLDMVAVLWAAVRELSDEVVKLKAA
jgi:hypothetical protein